VTNRWRLLPAVAYTRHGFAAVWTGRQLLVWGGLTAANGMPPPDGEAYTRPANTWTALPASPLRGRVNPTAVWTGRQVIVWAGTATGLARSPAARCTRRPVKKQPKPMRPGPPRVQQRVAPGYGLT
jgi:hypothetical protein